MFLSLLQKQNIQRQPRAIAAVLSFNPIAERLKQRRNWFQASYIYGNFAGKIPYLRSHK